VAKTSYKIKGIAQWAKIFGEPLPNYNEDGNEWSIDLEPDEDGINLFKRLGLENKIHVFGEPNKKGVIQKRPTYIVFARSEMKRSGPNKGDPNNPIPVFDADGKEWPEGVSIGNGSLVEIKFGTFDIPAKGKFKGGPKQVIYEVKVLKLVEYKRPEKAEKPAADGKTETWTEGEGTS